MVEITSGEMPLLARACGQLGSPKPMSSRLYPVGLCGPARQPCQGLKPPDCRAFPPSFRFRLGQLATHHFLDHAPARRAECAYHHDRWEAIERALRIQGEAGHRPELRNDRVIVALQVGAAACQEVECCLGRESGAEERGGHPVAEERVDQPTRLADEQRAFAAERAARASPREPVSAQPADLGVVESVDIAECLEVLAQARSLALPPADADVEVVTLWEDPAVSAGDRAEFERNRALPASGI